MLDRATWHLTFTVHLATTTTTTTPPPPPPPPPTTTTTTLIRRRRRRRIALKGAIRDFYDLLTAPRTFSDTYAQVARTQSCANHVQHIERLSTCHVSCATWCEGAARLLSVTELKSIYFSFIWLAETINRWKRGGNRSPRRKPLTTSFRECHILKPENVISQRNVRFCNSCCSSASWSRPKREIVLSHGGGCLVVGV